MLHPETALKELISGNRRFYENRPEKYFSGKMADLEAHVSGQNPFAVVLGCSDSRVPVEMIFDQSIGDLFVIRVAGNIAGPFQIGSVEYAVEVLGARLLMVLGHSGCGAVQAALQAAKSGQPASSENLQSILEFIIPIIKPSPHLHPANPEEALQQMVRQNVTATIGRLLEDSPLLQRLVETRELLVTGAEYSLHSGQVNIFHRTTSS